MFTAVERKKFDEITVEEWDRVCAVNIRGLRLMCKAAVPEMRKNHYGKIVNISSGRVFKGAPFFLHYDASKAAAIGMTRSLVRELGADNIFVNVIAPGSTTSENVLARTNWMGGTADDVMRTRALKRHETPKTSSAPVFFLPPRRATSSPAKAWWSTVARR